MKFPIIEVGYNIVFNNTGFDWTDKEGYCHRAETEPVEDK